MPGETWAVIVSTSRYWYNYRHPANTLSVYHLLRTNGVPDANIIIMMADDVTCNSRNKEPGTLYNHYDRKLNLYSYPVEIDYRGDQVTVETFLRILTDRWDDDMADVPGHRRKRLLSDAQSQLLIYLTGHGGDEFLKFQDNHEFTAVDLANSLTEMHLKGRYGRCLYIVDTCQAATMFNYLTAPNVIALSSSLKDQSSYSHHVDGILGVPVIDRFTNWLHEWFMENQTSPKRLTLGNFVESLKHVALLSSPGIATTISNLDFDRVHLMDFFGQAPLPTRLSEATVKLPEAALPVDSVPAASSRDPHWTGASYPNYLISLPDPGQSTDPLPHSILIVILCVAAGLGYLLAGRRRLSPARKERTD